MNPIKKIILSLLFAFILCQVIYLVFKKGIERYDVHKTGRLTEILLNNTNHNILFIGSSRVHSDIYPKEIDSITGLDSYNLGVEGGNLYEFKLMLDAYLVNHPSPQWLFLGVDYNSFDLSRKFFNYGEYFPFTKNPVIKKSLIENKHYNFLFDVFPFLKLTEWDDYTKLNSIKGLKGTTEILPGTLQYKGYSSNNSATMDKSLINTIPNVNIDSSAIYLLQSIVDTCNARGIKIVFMYMPLYKQVFEKNVKSFPESIRIIDSFAKKTSRPFWRNDHIPICDSPNLFSNPGHLNRPGSLAFSKILGLQIHNYIDSINRR